MIRKTAISAARSSLIRRAASKQQQQRQPCHILSSSLCRFSTARTTSRGLNISNITASANKSSINGTRFHFPYLKQNHSKCISSLSSSSNSSYNIYNYSANNAAALLGGTSSYSSFSDNNDNDNDVDNNDNRNNGRNDYNNNGNFDNRNKNTLISNTHDILKNIPIGSMTIEQIQKTRSLIYAWSNTNTNTIKNSNSHSFLQVQDIPTIMESLLERLIEEYDDGLNEDASVIVSTKDYNVVMNAYGKSISYYYNQKHKHRHRLLKKERRDQDDSSHNQGSDGNDDAVNDDIDSNVDVNDNGDDDHYDEKEEEEHESVLKAEALFHRMKERYDTYNNLYGGGTGSNNQHQQDDRTPAKPDIISYNTLLSAYSNQYNSEKAVEKAEEIMSMLEKDDNDSVQADTITYNMLMNIYANQLGEYGYAQKAEDVLLNMSRLRKEGSDIVVPDTTSFNIVLKAWRNSGGGIESAKRAEEILRIMIKLYLEGHDDVKPDGVSLSTIIYAYARERTLTDEVFERFDAIITLLMKESGDFVQNNPKTVVRAFNSIIDCIAKSDLKNAGEKANHFLQQLIDSSSLSFQIRPDIITFSNVIGAYVRGNDIDKAVAVLDNMINDEEIVLIPDARCFNKCLYYYCRKDKNVESAEALYNKMYQFAKDEHGKNNLVNQDSAPIIDPVTYNLMMEMYSSKSNENASGLKLWTDKGLTLLKEMEEAYESGISESLDIFPYELMLERLQKRSAVRLRSGTSKLSHDLLMKVIQLHFDGHINHHPSTMTCNLVLSALSREYTEEAAKKAMALLEHMEEMKKDGKVGVCPDPHTFNHVIVCWVRSGSTDTASKIMLLLDKMQEAENIQLDSAVFETILHGLSDKLNGDRKAAKSVINRMISLSGENKSCQLTPTCLNLAIKAECSQLNRGPREMAAFDVHRLLSTFVKNYNTGKMDVLPDVVGFNTAISSWANTNHIEAVPKAEQIFGAMERLSKHEKLNYLKPDNYTFSTMLKVFGKSRRSDVTEKADSFLKKIEQKGTKLDAYTYNGMLAVWAKSRNPKKAIYARQLLDRMLSNNAADTSSFNVVLKACASTSNNDKSVIDLTLKTYDDLMASQQINADSISFATATKAIHILSKDKEQREECFKRFFDDCCRHGALNGLVIKEMKHAISEKERLNVIGHDLNSTFDKSWTRNR